MTAQSRQDAIGIVHNTRSGLKSDLINKIGRAFYSQFCLMGYIKEGIGKQPEQRSEPTWQITQKGDSNYGFYNSWAEDSSEKALSRHIYSRIQM